MCQRFMIKDWDLKLDRCLVGWLVSSLTADALDCCSFAQELLAVKQEASAHPQSRSQAYLDQPISIRFAMVGMPVAEAA